MNQKESKNIKINFGCTIPLIALICLLAVLNIITWKTALIVGLCMLMIPLVVLLCGFVLVLIGILFSGIVAIVESFKR